MKTENGYTPLQFVAYLRNQLIPDFRAADMHATAEDFETALQLICGLADEREKLIAALDAITERAEAVSQGIPVHQRSEGVSQATHVAHMAGHLAQHCKPAREILTRLQS